ncbi:MAG TPA: HupE/UreJ family protein [Kofleriaceae bacterium]|nr:HupE/UreJ family protein [Kofleriaceae bacterium]
MRHLALALLVVLAIARVATAHDLRPGVLTLRELPDGDYALRLVPPIDSRGDARELAVELPPGCARDGARVHCDRALAGRLAVRGLRGPMKLIVVVERAGSRDEWVVDAGAPSIDVATTAPAGVVAWIRLGIAHILAGYDHLAFVLGLLLVLEVRASRRLFAAITAFTVAHSITLALAVLGVLSVRAAPVEACIALSVLLVAREALHDQPTAIRRMPWLAAGAFGLVHGLGFASALRALGVSGGSLARSLVAFNVGVELGQLAVIGVALAVVAAGRRLIGERRILGRGIHRTACYALGALAAWWLLQRVLELGGGAR